MAEEEASLDLEEFRQLQSLAKKPPILTLISSVIQDLEHKLSKQRIDEPPKQISAVHYVTLSSFSWEQDDDKVKGVDHEKLDTDFKASSFAVKFHDVGGKNYRCAIPRLNKEFVPGKCNVIVKPLRIVIMLVKASVGNWLDLYFKEDKV